MNRIFLSLLALLIAAPAAAVPVDFVREIQPILQQHCCECHGAEKQRSGLRLDIRSEAFKGGELYGEAIIPGAPADSPLIQFVRDDEGDLIMPPDDPRLSAAEVALLTRWVEEGAIWPDGVDTAELVDRTDHWSFKPVVRVAVPVVADQSWPRNEIDHFILARLEQAGLQPAPEADRIAWLRRVSFDLTGLPPTPEQVEAFVNDRRSDAYERVVDRLLSSPRYGEHWGQHWLDVVRYADTHGFEVNTERPNAWPYRDYVIAAFNEDLPYDRFIREQMTGDLLGKDAATGFLVTASVLLPGQIGKDEPSIRLARQDALNEIVINIGQTFLGLSVGCARCHHHKFDPISHRDYYAMQAFVAGVEYEEREMVTPEITALRSEAERFKARLAAINAQLTQLLPLAFSGAERPMVNARENVERFAPVRARQVRLTIQATNKLEPCIDELEVFNTAGENIALASAGTTVLSSGNTTVPNRHELRFVNDGIYGNSSSWMSNAPGQGWVTLEFAEEQTIERVVWGRDRAGTYDDRLAIQYTLEVADRSGAWRTVADSTDRRPYEPGVGDPAAFPLDALPATLAVEAESLSQEKAVLTAQIAAAAQGQRVFAGIFRQPDEIRVLGRGNPELPQERVAPAVPGVLGELELPPDAAESVRRQTLADWIAAEENPLTARVMVNRIWQGHFGAGLVETANDLGRNGTSPSHPELLDWLSAEFVRTGWSIKPLHRRIVLSAAYRQASHYNAQGDEQDAAGRLLWRYPLRRLSGEMIRDSMLAISGQLNLQMGGRGYDLFDRRGGLTGFNPIETFDRDGLKRMIYAHKVRRERDAVFGAFDCPDAGQSAPGRLESTTPIQALNLFNSRFVIEQAAALAQRVQTEGDADLPQQIERTYELVLSRRPSAAEVADATAVVAEHGLATLCRVLFNCNEFLFIP